jgi:hypothetical protein
MIEAFMLIISAAVAGYLLIPIFQRMRPPTADPTAALTAARAAVLRALHDLELDWATGKLSGADYRNQRTVLEAEAAALARRQNEREAAT